MTPTDPSAPDPNEPGSGAEFTDPGEAAIAEYEEHSVDDLEAEAKSRGIYDSIDGTGAAGNVVKEDLVQALAQHDQQQPQAEPTRTIVQGGIEAETGRPPLVSVAEELAAAENAATHRIDL